MAKYNLLSKAIKTSLITCAIGTVSIGSVSAEESTASDDNLEKIVVTGARGMPRSLADSAVPIDVLSESDLAAVPFTDTNDILKTLVPSYSLSRQPISDGASFIRPATLRGMPTDKTLVLVNSKRRHRSALVEIGDSGTQGPDIATIPSSALKGVEVLRDGAAAQYGSDAIAGVINFQLKDNDEGGSLSVEAGQFYEGDGELITVTGNIGFALGEDGFFSLSGEISDSKSTSRSEQYCTSSACLDPNDPNYLGGSRFDNTLAGYSEDTFVAGLSDANINGEDVVQPWGQPNTSAVRLFFNSGYEISDTMRFYSYGNYSDSEGDGGFFYRFPGNGTIENVRLADGSLYSPLIKFPGGFTPRFAGDITDLSILAGIEGEFDNEMTYDFSARYGSNEIAYSIENTINPSLGDVSPTSFKPGDLTNEEFQLSADFTQFFDVGFDGELVLAFGLTYMEETYELGRGDADSFAIGPYSSADPYGFCNDDGTPTVTGLNVINNNGSTLNCADDDDAVYQAVGVGSNGFPGFSPEFSGKFERDMMGAYVDLSADVTEDFFLQTAFRYEDYSDFGSELVGKLAFKYTLTDQVNLRGSVGTGFRAPTPGQQGTTNVSTRINDLGTPIASGIFPPSGPVGAALGAEALKPETSVNYSLGLSGNFDELTLTLDFYNIAIEDRFYTTSDFGVSTDPTSGDDYDNFLALDGAGVAGANTIGAVAYFQNAFDTTTSGMDFVATYTMDNTVLTASVNYNTTEIDSDASDFLNAEDVFDLENSLPEWKGVMSSKHDFDDLTLILRANIYGSYENATDSAATEIQEYDPIVFFDVEVNYHINDELSVSAGARNIFDTYPDEGEGDDTGFGAIYWSGDTVDWMGGYYYARLNYTF